jgi:hypothetical protein
MEFYIYVHISDFWFFPVSTVVTYMEQSAKCLLLTQFVVAGK